MDKLRYLILSLALLFVPFVAFAHFGDDDFLHHMDGQGMMGFGMGYGGFWGAVGWITIILVWLFLILGSIAFWKSIEKNKHK